MANSTLSLFSTEKETMSVNAQVRKLRKQLEEAEKCHKDSLKVGHVNS